MLDNGKYQVMFKHMGQDWDLADSDMADIEKFICELYGKGRMDTVNEVRYCIFQSKFKIDSTLPPNKDALVNHAKRANYQAAIHRRALKANIEAPSPIGHGWNKDIAPLWNSIQYAPDSVMKHISCGCKKSKCTQRNCSCSEHNLKCTELCKCENCENWEITDSREEEGDSDESSLDSDSE